MIAVIDWMTNTINCDIICDDLGFPADPYFEDGDLAKRVREAVQVNEKLYVSSAGNGANKHYQGGFVDSGSGFHDHDFREGTGVNTGLNFFVPAGTEITVVLQWDDPIGSSINDYDLYLDDNVSILDASELPQNGDDDPLEVVSWTNNTGSDVQVDVDIVKFSGIAKTLELFAFGAVEALDDDATMTDSVYGHKAVEEVISVAAIDSSDPGLDTIESFSSRGPSTISFPSPQIRQTSFITAVDGVMVTGAGGFPSPFFGTSAAAPHVAAIVALMLQKNPNLLPAEIMSILSSSSSDRGVNGFDISFGNGLINALSAIEGVNELPTAGNLQLNEIHIDMPGSDDNEYFEIKGPPGASLDGVWYIVLGDHSGQAPNLPTKGSGTIEFATSLDGLSIPESGFFLGTEFGFNLAATPTAQFFDLIFENNDSTTHMIVRGYTGPIVEVQAEQEGDLGVTIDLDNDGVIDVDPLPWTEVIDVVAVTEPDGDEPPYGAALGGTDVPPDGTFTPGHIFRSSSTNQWVIGSFDIIGEFSDDTPGAENPEVDSIPLDIDLDDLSDSWELVHFGNLDQTATDDFDNETPRSKLRGI